MNMKQVFALGLSACMALGMNSLAFASTSDDYDYSISSAELSYDDDTVTGYWDEAEDTTTYKVQLYRGSTKIGSTKTTSEAEYDFTSLILEKGSGTYYFTVYPTKGGTDDMIESDTLQLTSSEISDLKSYYTTDSEDTLTATNTSDDSSTTANASSDSSTTGWVQLTDGRWQYSSDGSMVTSAWKLVDSIWYHFDSNSIMQTGWLDDNGTWYYLASSGAMLADTVTPDGYTVNASGAWVQ